jgi:cell fate (sporulation/competence/biofilm development) regulator YlbF (YheA/YmcA/DUF963 family)
MSNSYDIAYQLEKAIRESDEFKNLKKSYDEVEKDEPTKKMFENLREIQMKLQEAQFQGEDISDEDVQKAQQLFAVAQQSPLIANLMNAEHHANILIQDINKIISKPLQELYGNFQ